MCNLYRMEDKDWVSKWAPDVEALINLMPAYQMNPDQMGPIVRNTDLRPEKSGRDPRPETCRQGQACRHGRALADGA